jgi:hypothetical protein
MRFAAGFVVSAMLLGVAAAGCGGSHGSSLYTLPATKSCMEKAGFPSTALTNDTLPGTGGNLRVQVSTVVPALAPSALRGTVVPNQYVFLVFGATPAEAQKIENLAITKTVRTLYDQGISATRDYVKRGIGLTKNVFFYSPSGALTPSQRAKVDRCLR